jgi:hypothetical protein
MDESKGLSQAESVTPAQLTAGLLSADKTLLLPLLFIFALTGLIETSRPWNTETETFLFAALRQLVAMIGGCAIGARWIGRLRREGRTARPTEMVSAILAGWALWFLFSIPPLLPLINPRPEMRFLGVVIAVPAIIIAWRYFMLPTACLLGIRGWRAQLTFSRNLTRHDPLLPVRIVAPAVGLKVLLLAALHTLSPEGRAPSVVFGAPFVSALAPLLCAYLSVAFLMQRLPDRVWSDLGLDPYRQARLTTLVIQGRGWLARLLKMRSALATLVLGILVAIGNTLRLATTPPPVDISIASIALADGQATILTRLTDTQGHFRGFRAVAFFLASERGFPVARRPESATIAQDTRDVRLRFPHDRTEAELTLTFQTDRTALDMQRLENIYLWYGGTQVKKLDLTAALVERSQEEADSRPPAASLP